MNDSSSNFFGNLLGAIFGLTFTSFSFLWTCFYCTFIILGIVGFVLWVLMIIDVAKREENDFPDKGDNQRLIWILVLILGGWIGAVIYYFLVYKKTKR